MELVYFKHYENNFLELFIPGESDHSWAMYSGLSLRFNLTYLGRAISTLKNSVNFFFQILKCPKSALGAGGSFLENLQT